MVGLPDNDRVTVLANNLQTFGLPTDFIEKHDVAERVRGGKPLLKALAETECLIADRANEIDMCIPLRALVSVASTASDAEKRILLSSQDTRDSPAWLIGPEAHRGYRFWPLPKKSDGTSDMNYLMWMSDLESRNKWLGRVPPFKFCWGHCPGAKGDEDMYLRGCVCQLPCSDDWAHIPVWCGLVDTAKGKAAGEWGIIAGPDSGFDEWPQWWTVNDLRDSRAIDPVYDIIRRETNGWDDWY